MVNCCSGTNGCFDTWPDTNANEYVDIIENPTQSWGCWRVVNAELANQTGTNTGMNGPDGYPGGPTDWWYASPNLTEGILNVGAW